MIFISFEQIQQIGLASIRDFAQILFCKKLRTAFSVFWCPYCIFFEYFFTCWRIISCFLPIILGMLEDSESKECLNFVETSINRQVAVYIFSFYPSNFT